MTLLPLVLTHLVAHLHQTQEVTQMACHPDPPIRVIIGDDGITIMDTINDDTVGLSPARGGGP